jgi:SAM-dependent methyltransferase
MEQEYVHDVYEKIADRFNTSRYSKWRYVREFLDTLSPYSIIADVGCGNGKYLDYRKDITVIGNDMCNSLLEYAKHKGEVLRANGLQLPYCNNIFDAVISIAVLHHLSTHELRKSFLSEIYRILRPGGRALIVVWAAEQQIKKKWKHISNNDYFIPFHPNENESYDRFYHLFSKNEIEDISKEFGLTSNHFELDNWCIIIEKAEQKSL